jgi:hypothetical protein
MKHIKTYESKTVGYYHLIGYPEGNIIKVTSEELDELLSSDFDVNWDDEVDYKTKSYGQYRFLNSEEEELIEWLKCHRDPICRDAKKYNI